MRAARTWPEVPSPRPPIPDGDAPSTYAAAVEGRAPAPAAVAANAQQRALFTATTRDADVFRAHLDTVTVQATAEEVFARPGFADRIATAAVEPAATSAPGPSRAALLAELAAA